VTVRRRNVSLTEKMLKFSFGMHRSPSQPELAQDIYVHPILCWARGNDYPHLFIVEPRDKRTHTGNRRT
jgi:hypothetical protein